MPATSPSRLPRDAQRLLELTTALARSGSRLEDSYWENLLGAQLNKLLLGKKNRHVETALDFLLPNDLNAYEILVEQAETFSESTRITHKGTEYDALLFSAPMIAWTRYQLPRGQLSATQREHLADGLSRHILAPNVKLVLLPQLINFEHMPQTFQDTRALTQQLAHKALGIADDTPTLREPDAESDLILADARFLAGVVTAKAGEPLFRWQTRQETHYVSRDTCLADWQAFCTEVLGPLFTGCQVDYLMPDAYYMNNREADRRIRPLSLKAAVTWLQTAVNLPAGQLRATIAGCGESNVEEYRIGFSPKNDNAVIYGCIWPVLSKEEALADSTETGQISPSDEIAAQLKEIGVNDVRRLPGLHPLEFCDDCGAPHFPNPIGEMLHPELPEETDIGPIQFH
jgi:hypothetical protein